MERKLLWENDVCPGQGVHRQSKASLPAFWSLKTRGFAPASLKGPHKSGNNEVYPGLEGNRRDVLSGSKSVVCGAGAIVGKRGLSRFRGSPGWLPDLKTRFIPVS
jgi:hypothetical protein